MDFTQATQYLYSCIPKTDMARFPGEVGMVRMRELLKRMGNPHEKMKVLHIAGTSGKGSTAMVAAYLLRSAGKTVGLHVKPHIRDIRERMQINNTLVGEVDFTATVQAIQDAISTMNIAEYGHPTYYEVVLTMALTLFAKARVDYAVLETGVGGLYDGTNVVTSKDKVCIITKIGYDHRPLLGTTLEQIAYQKAMIMHPGNVAFTVQQHKYARLEIARVASLQKATLEFVNKGSSYSNIQYGKSEMSFDYTSQSASYSNLELGLIGEYQVENAAVALSAVEYIAKRDGFNLTEDATRDALKTVRFPGRFQTLTSKGKTIVLDGAHNVQKMRAFLSSLERVYPNRKFTFLIGFKKGKDIDEMLEHIIPLAESIIITDFFNDQADFVSLSVEPEEVARMLEKRHFTNYKRIYSASKVFNEVTKESGDILVVTGSLYLIGELYNTIISVTDQSLT